MVTVYIYIILANKLSLILSVEHCLLMLSHASIATYEGTKSFSSNVHNHNNRVMHLYIIVRHCLGGFYVRSGFYTEPFGLLNHIETD
jgi:hypothetical protein